MRTLLLLLALASFAHAEPRLADERILLHTNYGDMVLVLYPDVAPKHVAQVLKLTKLGLYDGFNIHRIAKGFVVQISNEFDRLTPITAEQRAAIHKIPAEFSDLLHTRGIVSMARFDDPNSAEVSFSILLGNAPHLDKQYTILGRLDQGMDTLEALEKIPVDTDARPKSKVTLLKATALTAAALAKTPLQHPDPEAMAKALGNMDPPLQRNAVALSLLSAILFFSVIIALLGPTYNREKTALAQIVALTAGIGSFALAQPLPKETGWIGIILFFGACAIYKLLGRFEAPEK